MPGSDGRRVRQQGRLQAVRQLVLGVVEHGPLQGLRDQPAQTGQHRPLVRGEGVRFARTPSTQVPTGRPEAISGRYAQALEAVGRGVPRRIQALQLLAGSRRTRAHRWSGPACPGSARVSGSPSNRSTMCASGYPRCPSTCSRPARRAEHDQGLAADRRRDLVRHQLHHVLHAHRLGQRPRQAQHLRDRDQPGRRRRPGCGPARSSRSPPGPALIRTLSPVVLGYSRNDSQSPGRPQRHERRARAG